MKYVISRDDSTYGLLYIKDPYTNPMEMTKHRELAHDYGTESQMFAVKDALNKDFPVHRWYWDIVKK